MPAHPLARPQVLLGLGLAAAVLLVLALARGLVPLSVPGMRTTAHPPCAQLPSDAAVERAIHTHHATVRRLVAIGADVSVRADQPCDGAERDRAVLRIGYRYDRSGSAVRDVITRADGFGVPVVIERD